MRAKDFVTEAGKRGKVGKHHHAAQPGAYKFRDNGTDRVYHLNRIMSAAAMADGSGKELHMDDESFVGKSNMAYPYSELEHNMMRQAFKTVRANHAEELIKSHKSLEPDDTHKVSPVKAFSGYK
jgi:hypothetical protein